MDMDKPDKPSVYNAPTQYDTDKIKIIRIEMRKEGTTSKYKIVFQGTPEDLKDVQLIQQQSEIHIKHENLTGFRLNSVGPIIQHTKSMAERYIEYYSV